MSFNQLPLISVFCKGNHLIQCRIYGTYQKALFHCCVLAYDEQEGWRIDAVDENGNYDGSIKLCRTGIDLKTMSKMSRKRASMKGDVPRVIASDFKEAGDHGTVHRCHRDLRQNDERA